MSYRALQKECMRRKLPAGGKAPDLKSLLTSTVSKKHESDELDVDSLGAMSYGVLQKACKDRNLPASGKTSDLRRRLRKNARNVKSR